MPSRYAYHNVLVLRRDGTPANGAQVTVRKEDGTLADIYAGDNQTTAKANPGVTDSNGLFQFYAGDLTQDYTINVPDTLTANLIVPSDTVANHRLDPNHAPGSIDVSEINYTFTATDVITHASLEANTHGLASNQHFVHTVAGTGSGATDSPTLGTVTASALKGVASSSTPGQINGIRVVTDPVNHLATLAAGVNGLRIAGGQFNFSSTAVSFGDAQIVRGEGALATQLQFNTGTHGVRINTSGTLPERYEDFDIVQSGAGVGLLVSVTGTNARTGTFFRGLTVQSGAGDALQYANVGRAVFDNCLFVSTSGNALNYTSTGSTGRVVFNNCFFDGNVNFSATSDSGGDGYSFNNCSIRGDLTISKPNGTFIGNYVEGDLTINSTADPCLLPSNANVVGGTVTGGVYRGEFQQWEYISGWVDLDNTGPTYTDEFYYFGSSGFASNFAHGLASRQLEIMIQVANNSDGSDERWTLYPAVTAVDTDAGSGAAGDFPVPQAGHFSAHIINGSNVRIVGYAGDSLAGSSGVTGDTNILFTAVDSQAIVANAEADDYDFDAAGGYALDRIWVRVFIRKAF